MDFGEIEPSAWRGGEQRVPAPASRVTFSRRELDRILRLYGRKVADGVTALVVPGSGHVKHQAEEEGLDRIFLEAGFEWRDAGCSMCMSMNNDKAMNGERVATTSNRNFEGRQGKNAKSHLMGPAMAAAAAITGRLSDVRQLG